MVGGIVDISWVCAGDGLLVVGGCAFAWGGGHDDVLACEKSVGCVLCTAACHSDVIEVHTHDPRFIRVHNSSINFNLNVSVVCRHCRQLAKLESILYHMHAWFTECYVQT